MIIPINFQYGRRSIPADLVYNFRAILDTILIRPRQAQEELEEDILLFKTGNECWAFDTQLPTLSRFDGLSKLLALHFKEDHFTFETSREVCHES